MAGKGAGRNQEFMEGSESTEKRNMILFQNGDKAHWDEAPDGTKRFISLIAGGVQAIAGSVCRRMGAEAPFSGPMRLKKCGAGFRKQMNLCKCRGEPTTVECKCTPFEVKPPAPWAVTAVNTMGSMQRAVWPCAHTK